MESEQRARCVACAGFLRRSVFVLFLSFSDFFLFFFWLFISAFYFFCDFETRHYKMQSCFYLTDSKVKDPSTVRQDSNVISNWSTMTRTLPQASRPSS